LRASSMFARLAARPHYSKAGLERMAVTGLTMFMAISNVYVLVSTSVTAALQQPYPLFRQSAELEAVDWAGSHLPDGAVVLASYQTGSLIPTRTRLRTVVGHWAETVDFVHKFEQVSDYFSGGETHEWRAGLLREENVNYIFYGPGERALGRFDPGLEPGLSVVYENGQVKIFGVVD
jgi:uncharacterized membrane protein